MEIFESIPFNIYIRKKTGLNYRTHYHKSIELIYVYEGKGGPIFVDGEEYILRPHSMMMTFPNQIHYYPKMEDTLMAVIMFEPSFVPDFQEYFEKYVNNSPVIHGLDKNPRLEQYMRILNDLGKEVEGSDHKTTSWKVIAKGIMTAFLGEVIPLLTLEPAKDEGETALRRILAYCDKNYKNDISLSQMANDLYLSYHYISRIFNHKLKIGFSEYIHHLRVMEAKRLLADLKLPISEVALECGFNSLCTFNRVFRESTKYTPSEYRKRYLITANKEQ